MESPFILWKARVTFSLIGSHLPLDWIPTWWAGSAVGTMPSFAKTFLTPWLPTRGRIPLDNCLDPGIQMEDALRGDGLLLTALET